LAETIRGINVVIGADTTGLSKALSDVNKRSKDIQSELRQVEKLLKLDPGNTEMVSQKQKLLGEAIKNTAEKLERLKLVQKEVNQQLKAGTITEGQYRAFQREIQQTEIDLKRLNTALKMTAKAELAAGKAAASMGKEAETAGIKSKLSLAAISSGAEKAAGKILSIKNALIGVGMAMASGVGLFAIAKTAIDAGEAVYKLSQKLHVGAAEASQVNRILQLTDTQAKPFISTITRLDKAIETAGEKGSQQTEALKKYGIALTDAHGRLLPIPEQLDALAAAYQRAADAGDEEAFVAEVLGARGAELIPLLQDYAEAKEVAGKVTGIGIDPQAAHESEVALKAMNMQVKQVNMAFASALMPIVQEFAPSVMSAFQKLAQNIKNHSADIKEAISKVIEIVKGVGNEALPVIKEFMGFILDHGEATKNIILGIAAAFVALKSAAMITGAVAGVKGFIEALIGIGSVIGSVIAWCSGVGSAIAEAIALVSGGAATVGEAVGLLVGEMTPVGWVITIIAALIAIGVLLYKNWDSIKKLCGEVWGAVANLFTTTIPNAFKAMSTAISEEWSKIKTRTGEVWNSVARFFTNTISNAFNMAAEFASQLPGKIGAFFDQLPGKIGYALGYALGTIAKWGVDTFNWVTSEVPKIINSVITWFAALPGRIAAWLTNALVAIGNWGISLYNWAANAIPQLIDAISTWFSGVVTGICQWFREAWQGVINWGVNFYNWAATEIPKIVSAIGQFFSELPGKLVDIGVQLIEGLWQGIMNMSDWLKQKVADFCAGIKRGFTDAFQIQSPSKVFMEYGVNIAQGLVLGVTGRQSAVRDAVSRLIGIGNDTSRALSQNWQSISALGNPESIVNVNHRGEVTHKVQTNDARIAAQIIQKYEQDSRRLPDRVAAIPISI